MRRQFRSGICSGNDSLGIELVHILAGHVSKYEEKVMKIAYTSLTVQGLEGIARGGFGAPASGACCGGSESAYQDARSLLWRAAARLISLRVSSVDSS